jgi:hypothetical protein
VFSVAVTKYLRRKKEEGCILTHSFRGLVYGWVASLLLGLWQDKKKKERKKDRKKGKEGRKERRRKGRKEGPSWWRKAAFLMAALAAEGGRRRRRRRSRSRGRGRRRKKREEKRMV